jgi:putative endonuclease
MVFNRRSRGNFGERLAVQYLLKQNYQIITCHYQKRIGEIDVIALDPEKVLVFFEVKARASDEFGRPEEAITPLKIKKLVKTAMWFMKEKKIENQKFRFDVLAIKLDYETRKASLKHFKNITQ